MEEVTPIIFLMLVLQEKSLRSQPETPGDRTTIEISSELINRLLSRRKRLKNGRHQPREAIPSSNSSHRKTSLQLVPLLLPTLVITRHSSCPLHSDILVLHTLVFSIQIMNWFSTLGRNWLRGAPVASLECSAFSR